MSVYPDAFSARHIPDLVSDLGFRISNFPFRFLPDCGLAEFGEVRSWKKIASLCLWVKFLSVSWW
jgi:hypothetical protein